jgi:Holliday junction resolvasome RuvABC endonuclease subunit
MIGGNNVSTILGLDISTACTGWCVIDTDMSLGSRGIDLGYIPMSNIKGSYSKAQKVLETLRALSAKYEISYVFIEENLQVFRAGLSSAKTLATLARFNGIVSYLCEEEFSKTPVFLNVNKVRRAVGINIIRKSKGGKPTKEQVLDWATEMLSEKNDIWPTKTLKSGPRKGKTVIDPVCYDMADAYVIALAGAMNISYQAL